MEGDTQITGTIRDLSPKGKYETIESHRRKNWDADSSREKPRGFEDDMCNVDQDYGQFSTSENDCNSNAVDYDDMDNDPQYKIFLDSLTVFENSCVLQASEKTGLCKPLKYEVDDDSDDDELELDTKQKTKDIIEENGGNDKSSSSSIYKVEAPILSSNFLDNKMSQYSLAKNDIRSEPINSNPFGHHGFVVEEPGNGGTYVSDRMCKTNVQVKKHKSRILRKSRKVPMGEKSKAAINVEKNKDFECDEDYQILCNYLRSDGNNLILKYKDLSHVVYEADEYQQNFRGSDGNVGEDDDCHYISNPSTESHSSFREQVMMILRKPYSSEEHRMLSQDIEARRPIERNMDLRFGREQSYALNKDGKSYLDHFNDFKRKLLATKCSHEQLNLLRGFFFWLQHHLIEHLVSAATEFDSSWSIQTLARCVMSCPKASRLLDILALRFQLIFGI